MKLLDLSTSNNAHYCHVIANIMSNLRHDLLHMILDNILAAKTKDSRVWLNYVQVIGYDNTKNSEALDHHYERCVDVGGAC